MRWWWRGPWLLGLLGAGALASNECLTWMGPEHLSPNKAIKGPNLVSAKTVAPDWGS